LIADARRNERNEQAGCARDSKGVGGNLNQGQAISAAEMLQQASMPTLNQLLARPRRRACRSPRGSGAAP